jgi:hypothetical protein
MAAAPYSASARTKGGRRGGEVERWASGGRHGKDHHQLTRQQITKALGVLFVKQKVHELCYPSAYAPHVTPGFKDKTRHTLYVK